MTLIKYYRLWLLELCSSEILRILDFLRESVVKNIFPSNDTYLGHYANKIEAEII